MREEQKKSPTMNVGDGGSLGGSEEDGAQILPGFLARAPKLKKFETIASHLHRPWRSRSCASGVY